MKLTTPIRVTNTGVNIATSGTSASSPLPTTSAGTVARFVLITVTQHANVRFGKTTATAVATDMMITPQESVIFDTNGYDTVAAIQVSAAGIVNVVPVEM